MEVQLLTKGLAEFCGYKNIHMNEAEHDLDRELIGSIDGQPPFRPLPDLTTLVWRSEEKLDDAQRVMYMRSICSRLPSNVVEAVEDLWCARHTPVEECAEKLLAVIGKITT